MTAPVASEAPIPAFAPLRYGVHLIIALAIAVVSPFTALAWPFAIGVGMVLGSGQARRERGETSGRGDDLATAFIAAIGVIAMLFFGAIIGGIIAIVVVVLAAFSERAAAHASPIDRGVARILVFLVPAVAWLVLFPLLGFTVDISFGVVTPAAVHTIAG